ncbi:bifunctional folylpolyglutamate synthase/ dihydrofolate synthase [Psychromonas sp. CNPT3]|uniref:bifunctional tetrahydrofolate synthase/dihydrofolate synthase n=1 Tax=Psychromonas sp. CNPT3 TaxID=314282 RepID=UPI00006E98F2|nr:bifunctional tetrahydrofolate synthase/dihydrofolate synthase [Psychromonas sp. CNPT3]AGH81142.1 bifunctional folylpolyglutamate synthase/ dihydrofolate synthase [Psychromonas sp. CNPT3]
MQKDLTQWLDKIMKLHPCEIELGLERITQVGERLKVINFDAKVITVAGTNGKGTTCAFLEEILSEAGYKVGVYSSPHILAYTERLRIAHNELTEQAHCLAFEQVEAHRGDISLSYFEYVTLACLILLKQAQCDFIILEVGLGGRLDATNMVNSDISVVTTIAIDHVDWLGDDREKIGFEKAGVFRSQKIAICGELDAPQSLRDHAKNIGSEIRYADEDFSYIENQDSWQWSGKTGLQGLQKTLMPMQNASTALAVIEALQLGINDAILRKAIGSAHLAGRLQRVAQDSNIETYLDVAHNPESAQYLSAQIKKIVQEKAIDCRVFAIVGMLEDKDIVGTFNAFAVQLDELHMISLDCPRGASAQTLLTHFESSQLESATVNCHKNIELAYQSVLKRAQKTDLIIIFGSFYTVSDFLTYRQG